MKQDKKKKITPTITKSRKKCVEMAKLIAKHRDKYTCIFCGKKAENGYRIEGSHVFSEGAHPHMSADPDNIKALCSLCHLWGKNSWHENPIEFVEKFKVLYPERYESLRLRAQQTVHMGIFEWQKKLLDLKAEYFEMIN